MGDDQGVCPLFEEAPERGDRDGLFNFRPAGRSQLFQLFGFKRRQISFTKALATELAPKIRVNAVAPGPVWTPLNPSDSGLTPAKVAKFGSHTPMGRPAQPEEIAPAYVFLASNGDSSYITGTVLQILGGETTGG